MNRIKHNVSVIFAGLALVVALAASWPSQPQYAFAAAGGIPEIPFAVSTAYEVASGGSLPSGLVLGKRYADRNGRIFVFWQLDPTLINDTFATGEAAVLKASHVVTNDVSDGINGGADPIFAGLALGSLAESTSGGTTRYGLFLVAGRATATITDGNAAAGDLMELNNSVDGGIIELDETATNLRGGDTTLSLVGVCLADDDANNDVDIFVSAPMFH